MSGQFWFPFMKYDEIVEAFQELGLVVSEHSLRNPTPELVTTVYGTCLQQVTNLNENSFQPAVQRALQHLDSSDMYSSALAQNILLHHLQRFARAAKIADFNAKDLAAPEPERTRAHFSAFINLVKFSQQRADFIQDLRSKSASINQERAEVNRRLAEVQSEVVAIKYKMAEEEPRCETLRQENEALTVYLIKCRDTQLALLQTVKDMKQQRAELLQRKEQMQTTIDELGELISRTRSRIVQSPDRLKRKISDMAATVTEDKHTSALHETKIRDLQVKAGALVAIEKDVRACVEQLQAIEKEVTLLEQSRKALAELKDQLAEKHAEESELVRKSERVRIQYANAVEKLDRAEKHAKDKRDASQKTIERLQREYEQMDHDRRDNDRQVEELRAQADEVERSTAEHMKQSQKELNELLTEYWKLRHATEVYMETLANKLGMQVTST
ncbi:uncharacterized protein PHACADRAFT_209321 [Phanerochaete carnosa HHB-10118-sp]|uniref:Uncharacterized protein n=1 Tax=Phanerochaete carnosa (strain HHB-10118-sp) TaxID=650164 RepID=K5WA22_PHACS|nr:uncharacterized protein PHACADRAFT_209321 [Phanerochaete carnosa HHB-10118-sp]EKM55794.1 hypothetical protein PHACADRAFT_209321 [Phanerochaete carnosa HHB-10118-sp]